MKSIILRSCCLSVRMKFFDQYAFVDLADDILSHGWLGSKMIMKSPVYSYGIAVIFKLFGRHLSWIIAVQMLFGIGAVYLFYRSTSLLFDNKMVGLVAAFMAAFYSPFIFYEGTILRAAPIAYTNLAAFYFLLRALDKGKMKYFLFAGLLVGCSIVLRPNLLFLLALIILPISSGKLTLRMRQALFLVLGICLVIAPLTARNKALGYDVLISTSYPAVFFLGNNYRLHGFGQAFSKATKKEMKEMVADDGLAGISRNFIDLVRRDPGEFLALYRRKIKMAFNGYEIPANLSFDLARSDSLWLKIAFLDFRFISPLAFLGLLLGLGKARHNRLLYSFLFLLLGCLILFHVQSRLRLVAVPFVIIPAAYAVCWLWDMLRRRHFRAIACAVIFLLGAAFYTKPDDELINKYFGSRVRHLDHINFVTATLYDYGENRNNKTARQKKAALISALAHCRLALATAPDKKKCPYYVQLGKIYVLLENYPEAKDAFARACVFDPESDEARHFYKAVEEALNYHK